MKRVSNIVVLSMVALVLTGCGTTELQKEALQDSRALFQCQQEYPDTWRGKCYEEQQVYNAAQDNALADSAYRRQQVLDVALMVLEIAADAASNMPNQHGGGSRSHNFSQPTAHHQTVTHHSSSPHASSHSTTTPAH